MSTQTSAPVPHVVRDGIVTDHPFVFATWLQHYHESPVVRLISPPGYPPGNAVYWREQHRLVETLLRRGRLLVAANPEDENHLFGWLLGEATPGGTVIHYAFVKSPFRKMGLGKRLVSVLEDVFGDQVAFFSHLPPDVKRALRLKPSAVYNPFLTAR